MTISNALSDTARRVPDNLAVIFHDRHHTFRQLDGAVTRLAAGLAELGIGPGDRVALASPNSDGFVIAYVAIMRAGASVVTVNPALKAPEIAHIFHDAQPKAALFVAPLAEAVRGAIDQASISATLVSMAGQVDGALAIEALLSAEPGDFAPPKVDENSVAAIIYTSGTTGRPKGAMLSHRNILFDARTAAEFFRFLPEDRILILLPMFHAYAATVGIVIPITIGATIVALERFAPELVLNAIATHKITLFPAVPPMYAALLKASERLEVDLSSLRLCVSGAAPLPPALLRKFEERFKVIICEGDGPTECGPVTCANAAHLERKIGTVGLALPGIEIRAVDENDEPIACGEIGELVVRGENVFLGYLNQPEATAEAMRGGWFHTGDLGTIDDEGYITIVDRKKDLIIVGGLNVYPREVEDVLCEHPGVLEAAVIGVEDELRGERVKAFIVLREAFTTSEGELLRHCRERLANFKLPKEIEFRDELPKSMTGKVLRRELREGRQ